MMDCINDNSREFIKQFTRKAAQQRIPVAGGLALTHRCNLRCVHCYLGEETQKTLQASQELSTAQWHQIIDDITAAGCLRIFITGGEPLLRKDFAELYRHVKTNGIVTSVLTNGTLLTEEHVQLFQDLLPRMIEISLYGATAETYERITGVPGSYGRCIQAIQRLSDAQVRLELKTPLMTLNLSELEQIHAIADTYHAGFRYDAALFPEFSGERTPLTLRVSPSEAAAKDFADAERVRQLRELLAKPHSAVPQNNALYNCGAGRFGFYIDAVGNLQPCLLSTHIRYALPSGSFAAGWQEISKAISAKQAPSSFACHHCANRNICAWCPALFQLETGMEETPSAYMCALSQERFAKLQELG